MSETDSAKAVLFGITAAQITYAVVVIILLYVFYFVALQLIDPHAWQTRRINARARRLGKRRQELKGRLMGQRRANARRERSALALRGMLERLRLNRSDEGKKAAELLQKAGLRSQDAQTFYLGARMASPFICGLIAYFLAPLLRHDLTPMMHAVAGMGGVVGGFYAPTVFVQNLIDKRKQVIEKELPHALDLFVICAEAGLSLDAAMSRVAHDLGPHSHELSDELGLAAIELGFLPDRREALNGLANRLDTASARGLVSTLIQTERYGTPLAQALRVLAAEFRNIRMMSAETKAARLPATLTVPMILFILPPLFVVLIGPAAIQVMASFHK